MCDKLCLIWYSLWFFLELLFFNVSFHWLHIYLSTTTWFILLLTTEYSSEQQYSFLLSLNTSKGKSTISTQTNRQLNLISAVKERKIHCRVQRVGSFFLKKGQRRLSWYNANWVDTWRKRCPQTAMCIFSRRALQSEERHRWEHVLWV